MPPPLPPPLSAAARRTLEEAILAGLAEHEDPALRECAREVRSGRVTLRAALAAPAYVEHVMPAAERSVRGWHEATEEQRERWRERAYADPAATLAPALARRGGEHHGDGGRQ